MTTKNWRRSIVAMTCSVAVAGCSTAGESSAANDCQGQVRVGDIVYTSLGLTDREASRFSTAEVADCDDVGPDPQGNVFPEHPRLVQTWRFAGYPTDEVIGVRLDQDSFNVYFADSVPRGEADRITEELESADG